MRCENAMRKCDADDIEIQKGEGRWLNEKDRNKERGC